MNRLDSKQRRNGLRAQRVRSRIRGTNERLRLSISITNLHVSAQVINDETHTTVAAATTVGSNAAKGTMTEKSAWVGTEIAKKAKAAKVIKVVLDRGSHTYTGRVKALAEAARAGGLEF